MTLNLLNNIYIYVYNFDKYLFALINLLNLTLNFIFFLSVIKNLIHGDRLTDIKGTKESEVMTLSIKIVLLDTIKSCFIANVLL